MPFGGILVGVAVGDDLGVADEDGVDDPQAGGLQRPARLGDLDDTVGDVRDLGLARPVRQADVGLDAELGEVARVSSGYSDDTRTPSGRSAGVCTAESPATATTMRIGFVVAFE